MKNEMNTISVYRFDDIELFNLLDNSYRAVVESVCREACDLAGRIPLYFPEYTLHNNVHLQRVAVLEGYILGERMHRLKQDEIVLLILAAFYHDIGMVCNENDISRLKKSADYLAFREEWRFTHPNMEELEIRHRQDYVSDSEKLNIGVKISEMKKAMLTDYLRSKHPEASKNYVLEHLIDHPVLGSLAADLGEICLSHGMSVDWIKNHPMMTSSRKFVCYVLRLADILDFDGDRTPDVLFRAISFSSPVSLREWEKHKGVKDWSISDDDIAFTMEYSHPVYEKAARDYLSWIDSELEQVHFAMTSLKADLPDYGIIGPTKVTTHISSKGYEYHDLSFSLSRDEVVKLFLTDKLYGDQSLFVRELLQNSLDALRLRKAVKAMKGEPWNEGEVRFRHYLDDKGRSVVECVDNGCGMDMKVLEQYFGRVGRSYYRSNDFERLRAGLKQAGVDFDPCSQFGIGFMSVFMVADCVSVETRTETGEAYIIEISGLSNLFVIRKGDVNLPVGTTVRIIERSTPPAFDELSDHVKLVDTVDSYAVTCDFPVYADCTVPGIEDSIHIEAGCLLHETFLESLNVKRIKTYEVDFSEIDRRLSGKMRQSFLVNKQGHITLDNKEASWKRLWEDNYGVKRRKTSLTICSESYRFDGYYLTDSPYTISCDGISITGVLGRRLMYGGQRKADVNDMIHLDRGGVFSLDIRGALKPELTPARTPLTKITEESRGWAGIFRIIDYASDILWGKVLNDCSEFDMPTFWSYMCIYKASLNDRLTSKVMSKHVLLDKIFLPVDGNGWLGMKEIESFLMTQDGIVVTDNRGATHAIKLSKSVAKWVDDRDFTTIPDLVSTILYRVAKLRISGNGKSRLVVDNAPTNDNGPVYNMKSKVVPFSGVDNKWLMSLTPYVLYNENSPLVRLAAGVWGVKEKNSIELYADSLCELLYDYFSDDLEEYRNIFNDAGKTLYYAGALYKVLDKDTIDKDFLPPYYILGRNGEKLEITEALLLEWSDSKAPRKTVSERSVGID